MFANKNQFTLIQISLNGDLIGTKYNISQSDKQIGPSSEHCCMNFMGIVILWNDEFSV